MSIEEIKDQVAKELLFRNAQHLYDSGSDHEINNLLEQTCKRYATECCKASLEKASIYAHFNVTCEGKSHVLQSQLATKDNFTYKLDKSSITDESNITLL